MAWLSSTLRVSSGLAVAGTTYISFRNWYRGELSRRGANLDKPSTQVRINAISATFAGATFAPFEAQRILTAEIVGVSPELTVNQCSKVALAQMFKQPIKTAGMTVLMIPVTAIPMALTAGAATAAIEYGKNNHSNKPKPS